MSEQDPGAGRPLREPLLNAPWPSLVVVGAILISYAWQVTLGGGDAAALRLGFAPADLDQGRWSSLITVLFVHGAWAHAIMNAVAALAFGPPVARLLGENARGVAAFFGFYLLCGVVSCLGYAVLHLHDPAPVIGASGAVSGLMGGASRLLGGGDRLWPIRSRPVISLGLGWAAANAVLAVFSVTPFMPQAKIAWEAHIAGYVFGLLLIGPLARALGRITSR